MNLSEPFIRRPVMTSLVMLAVFLLGVMAYLRLPISNLPDVGFPTILVTVAFPGASPETMANTVATPLEKEFMTISGVTDVTSTNNLGNSTIIIQFDINKDLDVAAVDVQAATARAKSKLPPNLPNDPVYRKVNPSDTPIIYIALTSATMTPGDLYTYANTFVGQRLSMIEGVAQVFTYGSPFAIRVQIDPEVLASYNLSLNDVAEAVRRGSPYLPTGQIDGKELASTIITEGQLTKGKEFQPLVVAYRENSPVRIKDIGRAIDSQQNDRQTTYFVDKNTYQPTVVLAVLRQPGANTVKVADSVKAYLPKLKEQLPGSVDLHIVFDRSESIRDSIHDVEITLIIAFILVVLVIFIYLGKVSDTIIPSLALPMSIIATFIVMDYLGYTLDNLSLLALTLAIGFIVDDAIVVLENIVRHVEKGETPWQASIEGSRQISFTIVSMTLSLIAVFIPLLFLGGIIGKIFREFSVTLTVVTLASGIISLTLTPMLSSRFIPPRGESKTPKFRNFSKKLNDKMLGWYKPLLIKVIDYPKMTLLAGLASVVLSILLIQHLPVDFIPDDDIGFIIVYTQSEQGTSSTRMKNYTDQVVSVLQKNPNIATIVAISSNQQYREGINFIRLKPFSDRNDSAQQTIQQLYPALANISGINSFIKNIPLIDLTFGTATKGAYQYTLQSTDAEPLYAAADQLVNRMRADETFQGVSTDMEMRNPQLNMKILRDQASTYGVDASTIEEALLLGYSGNRVTRIQTPTDQYDVIVELARNFQEKTSALEQLYVRSNNSKELVPLGSVAKWSEGVGPASINHVAQFPAVTISFNIAPGIPLGTALNHLEKLSQDLIHPPITASVKGAAETFQKSIYQSLFLIILSIAAIYIVLGILYESFIHPITILSTLPPATLGALITLKIFGVPLSLYAFLGLILLIGIVKKNGIMVVDYALEYRRERKESARESIIDACLVRFRPIMMTTFAAIFGAFPIVLGMGAGADARRPLGLVIIGGLLLSQLITLFLTPVIYLYLDKYESRFSFKQGLNAPHDRNNDRKF